VFARIEPRRDFGCLLGVIEPIAGIKHGFADRPVQKTGLEMVQPIARGELPRDGAFAGRSWTIDRNDHRRPPFAAAFIMCSWPIRLRRRRLFTTNRRRATSSVRRSPESSWQ